MSWGTSSICLNNSSDRNHQTSQRKEVLFFFAKCSVSYKNIVFLVVAGQGAHTNVPTQHPHFLKQINKEAKYYILLLWVNKIQQISCTVKLLNNSDCHYSNHFVWSMLAVGLSLASFSFIAIVTLRIFGTLIKTLAGKAVKVKWYWNSQNVGLKKYVFLAKCNMFYAIYVAH